MQFPLYIAKCWTWASRSAVCPIKQISPYFWSYWHHWLHRRWPKWQHFCTSSQALLLGLSGEGWLGSKPQSYTCRQVLEDHSWHHFLGHRPRLLKKKNTQKNKRDVIWEADFLFLNWFLNSLIHFDKSLLTQGHTNDKREYWTPSVCQGILP